MGLINGRIGESTAVNMLGKREGNSRVMLQGNKYVVILMMFYNFWTVCDDNFVKLKLSFHKRTHFDATSDRHFAKMTVLLFVAYNTVSVLELYKNAKPAHCRMSGVSLVSSEHHLFSICADSYMESLEAVSG